MAERAAIFWLVRHGQTDWNLEGRYQGQADPPLNERGLAEAASAAQALAERPIAAVYSSDLLRARQTAEIIARPHDLPIRLDARLREVALGDWEGQLFREIQKRYPIEIQQRKRDPSQSRPPGGETLAELWQRTRPFYDETAGEHPGKEIVLVSHGLTLAALLAVTLTGQLDSAFEQIPPNAQPVRLEWSPDGVTPKDPS